MPVHNFQSLKWRVLEKIQIYDDMLRLHLKGQTMKLFEFVYVILDGFEIHLHKTWILERQEKLTYLFAFLQYVFKALRFKCRWHEAETYDNGKSLTSDFVVQLW